MVALLSPDACQTSSSSQIKFIIVIQHNTHEINYNRAILQMALPILIVCDAQSCAKSKYAKFNK